jgi:hypothetical protein
METTETPATETPTPERPKLSRSQRQRRTIARLSQENETLAILTETLLNLLEQATRPKGPHPTSSNYGKRARQPSQ